MPNIFVTSTLCVDRTSNVGIGEDDRPYETDTADTGQLLRDLMREYGRVTSYVYENVPGGGARKIGWVFQKRVVYEDAREGQYRFLRRKGRARNWRGPGTYLRECWITIDREPGARLSKRPRQRALLGGRR